MLGEGEGAILAAMRIFSRSSPNPARPMAGLVRSFAAVADFHGRLRVCAGHDPGRLHLIFAGWGFLGEIEKPTPNLRKLNIEIQGSRGFKQSAVSKSPGHKI
jgi:hypothetical protein